MSMQYGGPDRRRGGPDRRNPDQRTKILLVDDHALFRVGMRQILEREADIDIVGEAEDARDAFTLAVELSPDIVLLDLSLPAPGGIETTQRIKREVPAAGIVALAVAEDEDQLFDAIKAGAAAFILKDISPNIFHVGGVGAGHAMKLVNNMLSGAQRLLSFEGLASSPARRPR
jgi:DNA-binding NarL/FixJ family response regulator